MNLFMILVLFFENFNLIFGECGCRKPQVGKQRFSKKHKSNVTIKPLKAEVGTVIIEGCVKKTCSKGKWRTKWKSSPAWYVYIKNLILTNLLFLLKV